MKCRTYKNENGKKVKEVEGNVEELREWFDGKDEDVFDEAEDTEDREEAEADDKNVMHELPKTAKKKTTKKTKTKRRHSKATREKISRALRKRHNKKARAKKTTKKATTKKAKKTSKNRGKRKVYVGKNCNTHWPKKDDEKVYRFCNTKPNFDKNGFIKKAKLKKLADELGRTEKSVRGRMGVLGIGHNRIRKMLKGKPIKPPGRPKKTTKATTQAEAIKEVSEEDKEDKQEALKRLHEASENLKKEQFPELENVNVSKPVYLSTFKYFITQEGNSINMQEGFPLFGVQDAEQWDKFVEEVMEKSTGIARALGVGNKFRVKQNGNEPKVLVWG